MTPFSLRLLGPFEARVHGAPLRPLRTRKGQWLLALLALLHDRSIDRAVLAALLWPDSPESAALANLRNSLADLRGALGDQAFRLRVLTPRSLRLDLAGADVDVVAFDAAVACGDQTSLERAVALYRGPLLEACAEEWIFPERQAREQAYLGALETLAAHALARGKPAAAQQYLGLAVAIDPLRESAHRLLMEALASAGNTTAALRVYRALRRQLRRDLDAEPDPGPHRPPYR